MEGVYPRDLSTGVNRASGPLRDSIELRSPCRTAQAGIVPTQSAI